MARYLTVKNLFSLFLLIWFAYGVWEAHRYAYLAKIFPFYISIVLVILALINIILELKTVSSGARKEGGTLSGSDLGVDWDIPMADVWRRFGFFFGIILVVYLFIYLIGYPLAMSFFICLFYRFVAKTKWVPAMVAGLAGFGFLALASHLLGMGWPEGLLSMPWPFG